MLIKLEWLGYRVVKKCNNILGRFQGSRIRSTNAKAPMPNNWQSPFAELAYFIRNFFLRLTTNSSNFWYRWYLKYSNLICLRGFLFTASRTVVYWLSHRYRIIDDVPVTSSERLTGSDVPQIEFHKLLSLSSMQRQWDEAHSNASPAEVMAIACCKSIAVGFWCGPSQCKVAS